MTNMEALSDFDIHEALKSYQNDPLTIQTPEASADLIDCEHDPESLTGALVNSVLNPVVDAITDNPETVGRASNLDSLQFLLKCAPTISLSSRPHVHQPDCELFQLSRQSSVIPPTALSKILDLIVSGLSAEADIVHHDLESEEQDSIQHHKRLLELYGFLLQWCLARVETRVSSEKSTAPAARGRGGKTSKAKGAAAKDATWDPTSQIQTALDTMTKVMKLKLAKIFVTTSERDTFISLFTRPVYLMMESEARVKNTAIRMHSFRVLCIAVKHHGHAYGIHDRVAFEFHSTDATDRRANINNSEPVVL